MIGQTWPAEDRTLRDPETGRTIRQLTAHGNNVHLYFTDNAFDTEGRSIIFESDRASGMDRAPHEKPHYNVFRLDLDSGLITQLTDEAVPVKNVTKTPDSSVIVYVAGQQVKALHTGSGAITTIYEERDGYALGRPSISADRRFVGFARNERVAASEGGPNYSGFKERYYTIKDGRITLAALDGSGARDVWRDTTQLAHFQFSPDDPAIAMFCHEGPWNLVTQRIWGLDVRSGEVWPLFRQAEQDGVGHEFWTQDGLIFFDNRGPGHDGTITSNRSQAVVTEVAIKAGEFEPYVGLIDRHGKLVRQIAMPFYCNHYHANPDNTVLVGDDVDDLVLIDIAGEAAQLERLWTHGTSWHTQSSHCHPTWSWNGTRILFASDRGGRVNVYLIEISGE